MPSSIAPVATSGNDDAGTKNGVFLELSSWKTPHKNNKDRKKGYGTRRANVTQTQAATPFFTSVSEISGFPRSYYTLLLSSAKSVRLAETVHPGVRPHIPGFVVTGVKAHPPLCANCGSLRRPLLPSKGTRGTLFQSERNGKQKMQKI